MRRALTVAAVVVLAACGSGGGPTQTGTNGSIRGTVADNTGAAVANAAVALSGNAQARTTSSGADGVYTFANVPPGTYELRFLPDNGYDTTATSNVVTVIPPPQTEVFVDSATVLVGGLVTVWVLLVEIRR